MPSTDLDCSDAYCRSSTLTPAHLPSQLADHRCSVIHFSITAAGKAFVTSRRELTRTTTRRKHDESRSVSDSRPHWQAESGKDEVLRRCLARVDGAKHGVDKEAFRSAVRGESWGQGSRGPYGRRVSLGPRRDSWAPVGDSWYAPLISHHVSALPGMLDAVEGRSISAATPVSLWIDAVGVCGTRALELNMPHTEMRYVIPTRACRYSLDPKE